MMRCKSPNIRSPPTTLKYARNPPKQAGARKRLTVGPRMIAAIYAHVASSGGEGWRSTQDALVAQLTITTSCPARGPRGTGPGPEWRGGRGGPRAAVGESVREADRAGHGGVEPAPQEGPGGSHEERHPLSPGVRGVPAEGGRAHVGRAYGCWLGADQAALSRGGRVGGGGEGR